MKKKTLNILVGIIGISIVIGVGSYSYSIEQTKQKGLQFGIELEQIQNDVKNIQDRFYSEKIKWEEGDISKAELLEYYDIHIDEFEQIISRYDKLITPELFQSSVQLLKLSSQTQLASDTEFIKWIDTGDELSKTRSDAQFQESLEYEMRGLVEFYSAKTGVKNYDKPEKFEAPKSNLVQQVIKVSNSMKEDCDEKFKDKTDTKWSDCINEAQKWREEHLP